MFNEKICIPRNYFFLFICAALIITLFYTNIFKQKEVLYYSDDSVNHNKKKFKKTSKKNELPVLLTTESEMDNISEILISPSDKAMSLEGGSRPGRFRPNFRNPVRRMGSNIQTRFENVSFENDRKVVTDPFTKPERRHSQNIDHAERVWNNKTRGEPDNFQLIGLLNRNKDQRVMQLFGRQLYPGSSQWEYYCRGKDSSGLEVKIPLNIDNNRELNNKEKIYIEQFSSFKGNGKKKGKKKQKKINKEKFIVTLYDYGDLRYNPFVI